MGRMYGNGKGISKRSLPYKRKAPRWMELDSGKIVAQIEQLAKKGKNYALYRI